MGDSSAYDGDTSDRREEYAVTAIHENTSEWSTRFALAISLLGSWLLLEAFLVEMNAANVWNDVIIGIVLVVLGGYNYSRYANRHAGSVSVSVLIAVVGLWLTAAQFVFGVEPGVPDSTGFAFWNDVIVGVLVLLLGAFSAFEAHSADVSPVPRR